MGRRAKNKQGNPEPLVEVNGQAGRPSAKKLGKRKAEFEDDAREALSKRPAKKIKESEKSKGGKGGKGGKVQASATKKAAPKADKAVSGKKKREAVQEEDEEGGSGDGWEDVDEEEDLKTHTR